MAASKGRRAGCLSSGQPVDRCRARGAQASRSNCGAGPDAARHPLPRAASASPRRRSSRLFEPFVDRAAAGAGRLACEVGRRKRKLAEAHGQALLMPWRSEAPPRRGDRGRRVRQGLARDRLRRLCARRAAARPHALAVARPPMFASDVGATRFRQLLLIRLIERVRPRSVLEVGCGNGINLILLGWPLPRDPLRRRRADRSGPSSCARFAAAGRAAARRWRNSHPCRSPPTPFRGSSSTRATPPACRSRTARSIWSYTVARARADGGRARPRRSPRSPASRRATR